MAGVPVQQCSPPSAQEQLSHLEQQSLLWQTQPEPSSGLADEHVLHSCGAGVQKFALFQTNFALAKHQVFGLEK